jgi:hypothetical protein
MREEVIGCNCLAMENMRKLYDILCSLVCMGVHGTGKNKNVSLVNGVLE